MDGNDAAFPLDDYMTESVGLTKREYFAAMAMQGLLSGKQGHTDFPSHAAHNAVSCADALIAALTEQED